MTKQEAEKILESRMKPILGFALKRCRTPEDAEDLSQEIVLKVYRALLLRDDVEDMDKFIRTVAHKTLCNYYRSMPRHLIGIPAEAAMTQALAERAGKVIAVEIDTALIPILKETLQDYDNVTVINEDILKLFLKFYNKKGIGKLFLCYIL